MVFVKIKRLHPDAQLPKYDHPGDSGADLVSIVDHVLSQRQWFTFLTGISAEVPEGYEIQIRPRSGLARRFGVTVLNSPGTVDQGYRGEIKVILINHGAAEFHVFKGDKIAQMVIAPVAHGQFEEVDTLSESVRGDAGFGSTGTRTIGTLTQS